MTLKPRDLANTVRQKYAQVSAKLLNQDDSRRLALAMLHDLQKRGFLNPNTKLEKLPAGTSIFYGVNGNADYVVLSYPNQEVLNYVSESPGLAGRDPKVEPHPGVGFRLRFRRQSKG